MIQRIQSIYLLLGALALVSVFFFDVLWESTAAAELAWFAPTLVVLGSLIALVALVAIFLYKDRARQLRVVVGTQVLTLIFTGVLYVGLFLTGEFGFRGPGGLVLGRLVALLLPIAAYLFFLLARRGIQSDIDLVKSMDRLR